MKKILTVLLFVCTAAAAGAQGVDVMVRNQHFEGDTFFFDVYLQATSSTNVFLGHADFSLNFNEAYFSTPTLNLQSGSTVLRNTYGNPTAYYDTNIGYKLSYTGINAYRALIYLDIPVYSNSTQFYDRVAVIDQTALTHRIGTFYITGATSLQNPELSWVTSGSGLVVNVTLRDSATQGTLSSPTVSTINPAVESQPTVQASNLAVTAKTNTTISLSWTAGNGTERIVLARQNGAIGSSDYPVDGLTYTASATFGGGSEVGSNGTYVVYKGSGSSVSVSGLSSNTSYTFSVLEVNGSNGWSENYYTSGVSSVSQTTDDNFINVNLKVFLQGAYNTSTQTMSTALRMGNSFGKTNLVPSAQPYNTSPWSYSGGESVDTANHPSNLVDWILVELRTTASGSAVSRRAGFLLSDGSVVDTNGVDLLRFWGMTSGNYYVVLKHRNHLPVMTRNSIALSSSSSLYDFTSSGQGQAYGTDTTTFRLLPMSSLGSGRYGMRAGDAGGSVANQVRYNGGGSNDRVVMLSFVGGATASSTPKNNVYNRNDVNLDRQVRYNGGGQNDRVRLLSYVGGATSSSTPLTIQIPNP